MKTCICETECSLKQEFSNYISDILKESIKTRSLCTIGLSGGSLGGYLASILPNLKDVDWKRVHFFFCDERHVTFDNNDSTYKFYLQHLFPALSMPDGNVHEINPDVTVETAAEQYETNLKEFFTLNGCLTQDNVPRFDLLLLGMGPDGHTCSLFPNHQLLKVTDRLVAPISDSPKPPPSRITLTFPVIFAARNAAFACVGEGKAEMVKKILECPAPSAALPATMVKLDEGNVTWFLDKGAASQLTSLT